MCERTGSIAIVLCMQNFHHKALWSMAVMLRHSITIMMHMLQVALPPETAARHPHKAYLLAAPSVELQVGCC